MEGTIGTRSFVNQSIAKLLTRFPSLFRRWVRHHSFVTFDDCPWTPFKGDPAQSRVALVTTAGVHLRQDPPFNMRDPAGDATFREIPAQSTPAELAITHDYYDHRDADRDVNVVLPFEPLNALAAAGDIGTVNRRHFSFMGHILPPHRHTLVNETAPRVAELLRADQVDIAILTPA